MFMTRREMLHLREHPDEYSGVMEAKDALTETLHQIEIWRQINERLKSQGTLQLFDDQRALTVNADRLARGRLSTSDGRPVTVRSIEPNGATVLYSSSKAVLGQSGASSLSELALSLTLEEYDVIEEKTGDVINQRARVVFVNLAVRELTQGNLSDLSYGELIDRARDAGGKAADRADELADKVDLLLWQIESRMQRRYALSATAMLLLLLGTTLAMLLRNSLPLVIYVWAFAPSILDVILISGGGHMVRGGQVALGTVVLWSGNALLVAMIAFAYKRLIRN